MTPTYHDCYMVVVLDIQHTARPMLPNSTRTPAGQAHGTKRDRMVQDFEFFALHTLRGARPALKQPDSNGEMGKTGNLWERPGNILSLLSRSGRPAPPLLA
jgi:hypothetical protein